MCLEADEYRKISILNSVKLFSVIITYSGSSALSGANVQRLPVYVMSNIALIDSRSGSYYGTKVEIALFASEQKVLSW